MIKIANDIRELDYENINTIESLGKYYKEWLEFNRCFEFKYKVIDIQKEFNTGEVIIIHNMWKETSDPYKISNGEEFIEDIAYMIDDYASCYEYDEESMNDIEYFWKNKINKLY